jgi:uncharacterized protein with HEPN domain
MRRDDALLLHILLAARKIVRRTEGKTLSDFESDEILQDSIVRQIGIIGEAANNVSREFRRAHPEISWADIIGMRHRIIHDYMKIDWSRVWDTATDDLPRLIRDIEPLVPPED